MFLSSASFFHVDEFTGFKVSRFQTKAMSRQMDVHSENWKCESQLEHQYCVLTKYHHSSRASSSQKDCSKFSAYFVSGLWLKHLRTNSPSPWRDVKMGTFPPGTCIRDRRCMKRPQWGEIGKNDLGDLLFLSFLLYFGVLWGFDYSKMANKGPRTYCNIFWMILFGNFENCVNIWTHSPPNYYQNTSTNTRKAWNHP